MYRDNKKDILLSSKTVKLLSSVDILIVGGGRASEIKLDSFAKRGFSVTVVAPSFTERILKLSKRFKEIKLEKRRFRPADIDKAHIVVIGTDKQSTNTEIAMRCREKKKLYAYLPDFKFGDLSIPYERETREVNYSISTRSCSPKTARYLGEKIEQLLLEYDDFVAYVCDIRATIVDSRAKREVMEFVNTDEFYEFYKAGYADIILRVFYGGDIFE